jgi:hypothetical protein
VTVPVLRSKGRGWRAALLVGGVTLAGVVAIGFTARRPTLPPPVGLAHVTVPTETPSPRATAGIPAPVEGQSPPRAARPAADVPPARALVAQPDDVKPVRPRPVELEAAGPFATADAERSFWQERLVGERLTLDGRAHSFGALKRALDQGTISDGERAELELRRTALEAKLGEQTQRVALIEQRIDRLAAP